MCFQDAHIYIFLIIKYQLIKMKMQLNFTFWYITTMMFWFFFPMFHKTNFDHYYCFHIISKCKTWNFNLQICFQDFHIYKFWKIK